MVQASLSRCLENEASRWNRRKSVVEGRLSVVSLKLWRQEEKSLPAALVEHLHRLLPRLLLLRRYLLDDGRGRRRLWARQGQALAFLLLHLHCRVHLPLTANQGENNKPFLLFHISLLPVDKTKLGEEKQIKIPCVCSCVIHVCERESLHLSNRCCFLPDSTL